MSPQPHGVVVRTGGPALNGLCFLNGEIVQDFSVAMEGGATEITFDSSIGVHPTVAEEFVTMREPAKAGAGLPAAKMSTWCRLGVALA